MSSQVELTATSKVRSVFVVLWKILFHATSFDSRTYKILIFPEMKFCTKVLATKIMLHTIAVRKANKKVQLKFEFVVSDSASVVDCEMNCFAQCGARTHDPELKLMLICQELAGLKLPYSKF